MSLFKGRTLGILHNRQPSAIWCAAFLVWAPVPTATKLNNIIGIFHTIMQFPLCPGMESPVTAEGIQARGQARTSGSVGSNKATN